MVDGAPKLPNDLEQPVTSTPQSLGDVGPPPVAPPIPQVPPAGTPPPPPTPAIPEESPQPVKPKSNFKKNLPKIAGGLLVMALLIGGILTGSNLLQQRTQVEQFAAPEDKDSCGGCAQNKYAWKWKNGECKKVYDESCKVTDEDTPPDGTNKCGGSSAGGCQNKSPGAACGDGGECVNTGNDQCSCQGQNKPASPAPSPKASPKASPTPSPSPSPTPSPSPSISCADLTSNKTNPALNDTVTLSCEANFSAVNPVAFFRYNVDGGTYTESSAVTIDTATSKANYNIAIDKTGSWVTECRVCTDSSATSCTAWGQVN